MPFTWRFPTTMKLWKAVLGLLARRPALATDKLGAVVQTTFIEPVGIDEPPQVVVGTFQDRGAEDLVVGHVDYRHSTAPNVLNPQSRLSTTCSDFELRVRLIAQR